jgi:hypothetical protein
VRSSLPIGPAASRNSWSLVIIVEKEGRVAGSLCQHSRRSSQSAGEVKSGGMTGRLFSSVRRSTLFIVAALRCSVNTYSAQKIERRRHPSEAKAFLPSLEFRCRKWRTHKRRWRESGYSSHPSTQVIASEECHLTGNGQSYKHQK